jgi:transposase
MSEFYAWLGANQRRRIRLAVMDMWKPFRNATQAHTPQAAILFDKFHVLRHLGRALDTVRKREYARLTGKQRQYIKGQKYTLLSRRDNLTLEGRQALKTLLAANKRLNTAICSGSPSVSCGATSARAGRGASSRTGALRSSGSGSNLTRNSLR